jgi:hypothetical protein
MAWRTEETRRVTGLLGPAYGAMARIVDLFNDPTLDSQARQTAIGAEVDREADPRFGGGVDRQAVEAALAALRGRASSGVLVTDGTGTLTANGRPAGTVRELLKDVVVANRLNLFNGVDVEFVVNLAAGRNGPSEVQVIARPRQHSVPPPGVPAERLEPLPANVSGTIVEIGAGQGSFAVDMVPMTEQAHVLLVQTEVGGYPARAQMLDEQRFGLQNVAPRGGPRSVVVFGDVLQNLEPVFGTPGSGAGVSRLIINNVNARYDQKRYETLARALLRVMAPGGRVEVQWDQSPEWEGSSTGRGHIQADLLMAALARVDPNVKVDYSETPGIPYPYDVTVPGGAQPGMAVPARPDPAAPQTGRRGVIVFRRTDAEAAAR